ncbi:MAG: aldo/keto reductase [Calditrichaceae bacterium]|nr:aldo/keto reductase [Calditrichaceae bacterium]MBN2709564.1 aldo/keto reductase [Calditrichaceae bacterium]
MRYKIFGKSGLRVSELALGTMTFGTEWGWGAGKEESKKIFDAFVKAGGNFIDTANRYTEGTSEKYVGEFIKSEREHFVLATKYTLFSRKNDPNFCGNHRKNMVRSIEESLKRLQVDYIDLYWLHAWDFTTPVEEVMRALDDLVRAGKILYIGISDTPAWIISQANTLAELSGWTRFVGLQIEYSLVERTPERELLPMARAFDMAVTPWAVLGSGFLSGKYKKDQKGRLTNGKPIPEWKYKIVDVVTDISEKTGYSPSQIAISWVRQQKGVIIPILGARTIEQLKDNLGSLDVKLDKTRMDRLNKVSEIEMGFPHRFLDSPGIKENIYGGLFDRIDNHHAL